MSQLRSFPRYFAGLVLQLCAAILSGALLLSAVCLLPSAPMDHHLTQSAPVFAAEGIYPSLYPWCTSQLDSTTDALILLISACDSGESPILQAMSGTRNTLSAVEAASDELAVHYGEGVPFDGTEPYYQYWHGYQLLIRPLLCLMNYQSIRLLNGLVQTGLLLLVCLALYKAGLGRCILPYAAAVAMLMPAALAKSLQFSSCYYLFTLGTLAVLWKRHQLDRKDGTVFLFIGIATAYFDFLTYPIVTLGIPAVVYFCLRKESTIRDTFCRGVKICFSWGFGYLGMWAGKWLLGSLILRQNILTLAADKVTERAALDSAGTSLIHQIRTALSSNLRSFLRTPATLLAAALALVLLVLLVRAIVKNPPASASLAAVLFPFVILMLIPFVWYGVTSQHAVVHHWFTNKNLAVTVFALLAALAQSRHTIEAAQS